MPSNQSTDEHNIHRRRAPGLLVAAFYAPAMGVIAAGVIYGVIRVEDDPTVLLVSASLLVLALLLAPIAIHLDALRSRAGRETSEQLERLASLVRSIGEQAALSDDARRVLNRGHERRLLRAAIEEDIAVEDYDAAMVLVDELANRFGYRADAEEFRSRIEEARRFSREQAIDAAIMHLDSLIASRRWEHAAQEAARIGRLYPDVPRASDLTRRVQQAHRAYKEDLEQRFIDAARADRCHEAMELLRELDAYLTETEAAPFRETARAVIDRVRKQLGEEFKQAVLDMDHDRAERIGQRIIDDFPNSRMSQEVREVLDSLRQRAQPLAGIETRNA